MHCSHSSLPRHAAFSNAYPSLPLILLRHVSLSLQRKHLPGAVADATLHNNLSLFLSFVPQSQHACPYSATSHRFPRDEQTRLGLTSLDSTISHFINQESPREPDLPTSEAISPPEGNSKEHPNPHHAEI